jgi:hypothetical protein
MTAQAVDKPSVPHFSVKLVDNSYDVLPSTTTTVDQYTGKETALTIPGYHVDQRKFEVRIKNQQFISYSDTEGNKYAMYYHVQVKGHFGEDWKDFYRKILQSDSDYTTITPNYIQNLPAAGSQVDFRVEAIIGHQGPSFNYITYEDHNGVLSGYYLDVVYSGWSEVLTFTVSESGGSSSSTLPPTNTQPITNPSDQTPSNTNTLPTSNPSNSLLQNPWITILVIITAVCVITIPIAIFTYQYGKRKNKPPHTNQNMISTT